MKPIRFDYNNLMSLSIGSRHGITASELRGLQPQLRSSLQHLTGLLRSRQQRELLGLEWARLPFQETKTIAAIKQLANHYARRYTQVLFLGIGGSYLGLKAAQDALCPAYYNEFASLRHGRPRIYFEGNNLDPQTLTALLKNLDPRRTCVVVISKSGETTETKAAFMVTRAWLRRHVGKRYGRQIIAITDPDSGALRKLVNEENARDPQAFRSLPLYKGVGGRFSEFNMGLLHLALIGVDIDQVLSGCRDMFRRCMQQTVSKNPALLYAGLCYLLWRKKGKPISIFMPFAETLKSTADWYSQLLAESLGKQYSRRIVRRQDGLELWQQDKRRMVHVGRTPVACRGTNDLHSLQQNNIEGQNDKIVTFIRIGTFGDDVRLAAGNDILSGCRYSYLLGLAQEATEWALVRQSRPNCTLILPAITPYYWGSLLFFFEMATAFEGELLGINAFDQPGVEGYKNYMYYTLKKPGLSEEFKEEIKRHPLSKEKRFVL